jgi:hypothetical protein
MSNHAVHQSSQPRKRFIWLTMEPADIIELKQIVLDNDAVLRKADRLGLTNASPSSTLPSGDASHGRIS